MRFGLDFVFKVNRTKPNRMLFYLTVWMTFTLKTESNRTANTPKYTNAVFAIEVESHQTHSHIWDVRNLI